MKKLIYCIVLLLFTISSCDSKVESEENSPKISQEEALRVIEEYYKDNDYSVFVSKSIIKERTMIVST